MTHRRNDYFVHFLVEALVDEETRRKNDYFFHAANVLHYVAHCFVAGIHGHGMMAQM